LFAVTHEEKYARFIRDMLLRYAALYPTLPSHPKAASEASGRLFWQSLNESVWLVHVAQAYDCVYEWLSPAERKTIETKLLRPMADFFTNDHAAEHDRIHNHGTWMVTAVGMLGFALGDSNLVDMALYGTKKDGKGGFMRQLDILLSPDGYYTEGPYYTRYALMPLFLFAYAIDHNRPGLRIFEYRNQVLRKAFYAAMQQTYTTGCYIPFNDALKEMSFMSGESVIALDITYGVYGHDEQLLEIASRQQSVMLSGAGLAVAEGLAGAKPLAPFNWKSVELRDGPNGDQGGVGLLRSGQASDQSLLVLKYTAHGESHGHYDKLGIIYYDQNREILQDYGAVRFINVEPKDGGRYLPETASWARQTIAHNTVTVDEQSHYGGRIAVSSKMHADRHFFSAADSNVQVMSAKVDQPYPGVRMQRTVALVRDAVFTRPIVIDVLRVESQILHKYDLPFYYMGQLVYSSSQYAAFDKMRVPLGSGNGYQHLWKEAEGKASGPITFTWLNGGRYYSLISAADSNTTFFFTRSGASDPNFNLRNDPAIMLRVKDSTHVFASVLEPHGFFDPVPELSNGARPTVTSVNVLGSTSEGSIVEILATENSRWLFMVANGEASESTEHRMTVGGKAYTWTGNYSFRKM
jgi:hypothetical protein